MLQEACLNVRDRFRGNLGSETFETGLIGHAHSSEVGLEIIHIVVECCVFL